ENGWLRASLLGIETLSVDTRLDLLEAGQSPGSYFNGLFRAVAERGLDVPRKRKLLAWLRADPAERRIHAAALLLAGGVASAGAEVVLRCGLAERDPFNGRAH